MELWMQLALWLTGVCAFVVGFFAGGLIAVSPDEGKKTKLRIEKLGVWCVEDRAYKLTRINAPDPR